MRAAYATIIDDVIYIGGGVCPYFNDQYDIFLYHLKENKWTKLPIPLPQCYGALANINNKVTMIGGVDHNGRTTNKALTLQDDQWTSLYGDMNSARYRPAVLPHHHYTIVAGGQCDDYVVVDSIEVFDGHKWTISKMRLPQPMSDISATTSNNSLIIAGYTGANGGRYNGVYITTIDDIMDHSTTSSSTDNTEWTQLIPTPYWNTTIVPHITPPVIVGGEDENFNTTDHIMAYDNRSDSWRAVSSLPIKCSWTTILSLPHTIIMVGGCTDDKTIETANATSLTSVMVGELVKSD